MELIACEALLLCGIGIQYPTAVGNIIIAQVNERIKKM